MPTVNSASLVFSDLDIVQQESFSKHPAPVFLSLPAKTHLYKWTQYPLVPSHRTGFMTEYWSPWHPIDIGPLHVPGFAELRKRYANVDGGVARPQQFMRARSAVTQEWNTMSSITKAELKMQTWGFLGICAPQPATTADQKDRKVLFIGGNYQLVLPFMTAAHIFKL